jgi:uncharacterized protein YecE (DUF72 family)
LTAVVPDVHVGLSGWDYPRWQGDFYPADLAARRRLEYAAQHFDTLEVNGSFYSLQRPTTYQRWYDATPTGFVFALKGGRFITHLKRLRDVDQGLANFFASGPLVLAEKLGPVLWQLPASIRFDEELIAEFLDRLPRTATAAADLAGRHDDKLRDRVAFAVDDDRPVRHALEVRHRSFDDPRFYDLLTRHGVANVASDSPTWPLLERRTTDFAYVRLHGHTELYHSGYSGASLDSWAERCRDWGRNGPVYVYFDNDARGRAPHDALGLMRRLGLRAGDAKGRSGSGGDPRDVQMA